MCIEIILLMVVPIIPLDTILAILVLIKANGLKVFFESPLSLGFVKVGKYF